MGQLRRDGAWVTVFLLVACSGGDGNPPGSTPVPAGSTSAKQVAAVANEIYDAWDAGRDVAPSLEAVLRSLGVEMAGPADASLLRARIQAGQPVLLKAQLAEMARAYAEGTFIKLDDLVGAMSDKGAQIEKTGAPLTRAFLSELFGRVASKDAVTRAEAVPALVVALGRERARRMKRGADPVWGDGWLDPLQGTLMLFSLLYSGNDQIPSARSPSLPLAFTASAVGEYAGGELEGMVEQAVQIPITRDGAAKASLCVSLLLYGHKLTVRPMPASIYHQQTDGNVPYVSRIDASLTFEDDYWDNYSSIDRELLEAVGCRLPRRGPVSGALLAWDVGDDLPSHGSFDITPMRTDDGGKAVASWKAVPETTPMPKRTFENQRSVADAVIVQASGLVPDWERLSMIVAWLRPTGTQGRGNLEVRYYVDPCLPGGAPRAGQAPVLAQVAGATCQDSWSGMSTMLVQPGGHTVSAQVTWERAHTAGGVVTYQPRGTASYKPAANCAVSPSSVSGMEINGELHVDTTTDPPTFRGGAFAVWTGTYTCPEMAPFTAAAGGPWFYTTQGTVTENGRVIAGQNDTLGIGSFRFTRN